MDEESLSLSYRPFSLSLTAPLETAHGPIEERTGFLVRVEGPGGTGIGEASPLPGWTESHDACETALERAQTAIRDGPEAALEVVESAPAARHGLVLAFADFGATQEATPLYQYLSAGPLVGRIPVNATISDGTPEETAAAASAAVDRGHDCCKLKAGVQSLAVDLERVRAVRDAVGSEVALRVDANGAWSYDEAMRAIETLATLEVELVEQPLPAGALEGHTALRGHGVDIALDEGLLEHGVDAICEVGAADALVLKPMALGGVDRARQIAIWAMQVGVDVFVTTTIDAVVARVGAVHLAAAIPDVLACGLETADLLADDLAPDPVLFENGAVVVPQAKGLGVEGAWST